MHAVFSWTYFSELFFSKIESKIKIIKVSTKPHKQQNGLNYLICISTMLEIDYLDFKFVI